MVIVDDNSPVRLFEQSMQILLVEFCLVMLPLSTVMKLTSGRPFSFSPHIPLLQDDTVEQVKKLQEAKYDIRVIVRTDERGLSSAVLRGFKEVRICAITPPAISYICHG